MDAFTEESAVAPLSSISFKKVVSESRNIISKLFGDEYKSYWENAQYMNSTSTWGEVTRGVDLISNLNSYDAAAAFKELGGDLQAAADSIAQAASVGISTDLEAAAQGLGYGSFASAVAAYNAKYGTNYTPEQAAKELGN